tara:strand:+ start:6920 stop:7330 length:411 start_codon:yes stop_codon:yes gene_type:complete
MDKNTSVYKKAYSEAKNKFKIFPSAYASMYIVKRYKEMGGKFSGKTEKSKSGGTSRWLKEEWIQVKPYLQNGKIVKCGEGANKKACRPLKRINDETSITLPELIKIHGKTKLLKLAGEKQKNMSNRINWKLGKLYK